MTEQRDPWAVEIELALELARGYFVPSRILTGRLAVLERIDEALESLAQAERIVATLRAAYKTELGRAVEVAEKEARDAG